jgi:addiction module HigA family antidote
MKRRLKARNRVRRYVLDLARQKGICSLQQIKPRSSFMAKEKTQTPAAALQTLMDGYQVTPAGLAKIVGLSQSGVRQIAIGQTRITVPVALRFAKYFGTTPDYWINLQTAKDLSDAAKDPKLSAVLKAIPKAKKPAAKPAAKTTGASKPRFKK